MRDEHADAAWAWIVHRPPHSIPSAPSPSTPRPRPLQPSPGQHSARLYSCWCSFPCHVLSWTKHPLEMGAGIGTMLLYSPFISVNMEIRDFDMPFPLVCIEMFFFAKILSTQVCCLLHILFFLSFSHFLSFFFSVLSYNMSSDCWACLTRQM